jgi:hypothetical protein
VAEGADAVELVGAVDAAGAADAAGFWHPAKTKRAAGSKAIADKRKTCNGFIDSKIDRWRSEFNLEEKAGTFTFHNASN